MLIFKREITHQIRENLEKRGITIILGPRQSGKTTLVKALLAQRHEEDAYFNCEATAVRRHFVEGDTESLRELVGKRKLVVFDEAQTIENIGKILKLFHDTFPEVKIIATGSSSFELANRVREPLTGRADEFMLYPLSLVEIASTLSMDRERLDTLMKYGCYPAVVAAGTNADRERELKRIATNYLYKDVFVFEGLRNPKAFENLVMCLAARAGNIVHTSDVARDAGIAPKTADEYMRLLEQSFVIRRVHSFSRNHANELKKSYKVYFLDVGIRNAFSTGFNEMADTADQGKRFESLVFAEFLKRDTLLPFPPRTMFWRTTDKKEIDFVRESGANLKVYEVKLSKQNTPFHLFLKRYPNAITRIITPDTLIPACATDSEEL
ncbi:MAG: ATP-binding protein [Candidatus Paceibacterota bacterium]